MLGPMSAMLTVGLFLALFAGPPAVFFDLAPTALEDDAPEEEPPAKQPPLHDGVYTAFALGYSADVRVRLLVKEGRMHDIQVHHEETMDLGATFYLPRRVLDKQTLDVDAFSGATVTSEALLEALREASLKSRTPPKPKKPPKEACRRRPFHHHVTFNDS